jgi:hypothetical protein
MILAILIVTIVITLHKPLFQNALAATPPFSRQEVLGHSANWFDMYNNRPVRDGASYSYIDIKSVNYFSDGRTLNATIWLADFQPIPPPDHDNVNYGMYFDADFNKETGVQGIDYKVEISWDKKNQTWTKVFEEWGTNITQPKTLGKPEPADIFYENGRTYVTLSADLDAMISPNKYRVVFYAEVIDSVQRNTWIVDATNWVSIPPPEIAVTVLPSSMDLRQGDASTVEVRLNSTTDSELTVKLLPVELSAVEEEDGDPNDFGLEFELEELHISPHGIAASPLHINAFDHTDVSLHTIVILANSTIPEESLFFGQIESEENSDNDNNSSVDDNQEEEAADSLLPSYVTDETNVKQSTFLVQVDKWDVNDRFNAFIDQWFTPLTSVYTTITGIIGGILGWIYGRRRGKKDV